MTEAYSLTSRSSALVPESELSHRSEAQYGLVPRLRHHGGKNIALRAEKPIFATKTITKTNTFLWFKSSMVQEMFFSEAMFLLLDVCNNDSYVIRAVAWA